MSDRPAAQEDAELAPPAEHQNLEGWIPPLATDTEIKDALEKAFDYRGDVTITTKSGQKIEGYIFDRKGDAPRLADCHVRLFPKNADAKLTIPYHQIAALTFTGKDTAAGKSWETWVKKYEQKKAAGEKNIRLDPEKLD